MFEDKRYDNQDEFNQNRFFMPENNTGLNVGNDNLNFMQQPSYVPEPEPIPKEKKNPVFVKRILIVLIVFIIIGVFVGLIFAIKNYFTSPYKIYSKALNDGYDIVTSYIKELDDKRLNYDVFEDTLASSGSLKLNTDSSLLKDFNDFDYGYYFNVDVKNKSADGKLTLSKNNKNIIQLNTYLRKGKFILEEDKVYQDMLEVGEYSSEIFDSFQFNSDYYDYVNVLKCVKDYLTLNINQDNLSKEKKTIKINNKNVKVTNNKYDLNEKQAKELLDGILDALQSNDNAMESLADILGYSKRDIPKLLESLKNSIKTKEITINIYTKGFASSFVGFSVVYDKKEVIQYVADDSIKETNVVIGDFILNIVKKEGIHYIQLYYQKEKILESKIKKSGDVISIEFNVEYLDVSLDGALRLDVKRIGDKRQTLDFNLNFNLDYLKEKINFELEMNNKTQVGTKMINIKIDDVKKYESLLEEEKLQIQNNLEDVLLETPFYSLFQHLGNIVTSNSCANAYDCECEENNCVCKYLDENNIEQNITCNKDN